MNKKYLTSFIGVASISCLALTSLTANANFYVDYQGTDSKTVNAEELRRLKGAPDGYRILADKTYGVVHQVGKGSSVNIEIFGAELALKDAISMMMPDKWIAYIDENLEKPVSVDFQAKNEPWIGVLARVGINYGYRFVVDWDQKLLQISPDEDFVAPDYNDPIALKDPHSGRTIFVYSAKPIAKGGVILVDGKAIPVKLEDK